MCSINDEDTDDIAQCMEKKSSEALTPEMCKKCNERKPEVSLRVHDVYCRECFLTATTHKFRAALGKSKIVRPRDHVLLAFSGSQSSVALLHLVQSGLNEANHKRLLFSCTTVFIDEGAVLNQSTSARKEVCNSILEHVKESNIPIYIASLEKCLDHSEESYFNSVDEQREEQLKELFACTSSLTAKEDLLLKLRNRLLLKIAKQLKCTKIFTAESTSHLAVKLLSNVSLGRGGQLPLDVGFCDTRDPEIMLLRPMRDFMSKEVVFYNIFNKLESINIPSLGTKAQSHASIQKLTEKFVTDLQEDFPSTVSTIFRTGDKLKVNTSEGNECCVLCQAPLDTVTVESSALQATEFSRMVSTLGPIGFDNKSIGTQCVGDTNNSDSKLDVQKKESSSGDKMCCEASSSTRTSCGSGRTCKCEGININVTLSEAESCLCYSCRLIAREMVYLEALPSEVLRSIKERHRFKEMRKEIEDFLL